MKNVIFAVFQFALFFVAFGAGSLSLHPHVQSVLGTTAEGTRVFVWDGLLLSLALAIVILAIEAVRKRIRTAGPWTTAAFVLAAVAGLAMKFGLFTRPRL
ncbi:MAG TPA: hypothetical protein VGJ21_14790 [Terracidiphilus sp.]|jgi:hypothetical protein